MRKSFKSGLKILYLLVIMDVIFFNFPSPKDVIAWGTRAHTNMTKYALEIMTKFPNDLFKKYSIEIYHGVFDPDINRVIKHDNLVECASMINSLAKQSEKMIKEGEDWAKIMFTMGQATHYIQDLNCPYHTIPWEKDHENFEFLVASGDFDEKNYDGFYIIKNYKIFAENTNNYSYRYLKFTSKLVAQYDIDLYKKITTPLWERSINNIVHLWLTILWNGLGEKKYKELGFPDPVGTRDDQRIKFYRIKELK